MTLHPRSGIPEEKMKVLSFRAPESFIKELGKLAKLAGLSQSDYVRRAVAELNDRFADERIAGLSRKLSAQSLEEADSMEGTLADGLDGL